MKTIEQWFKELPEPYRSQALENTLNLNQCGEKILKSPAPNIKDALMCGFIWRDTQQGVDYWRNFCNTL